MRPDTGGEVFISEQMETSNSTSIRHAICFCLNRSGASPRWAQLNLPFIAPTYKLGTIPSLRLSVHFLSKLEFSMSSLRQRNTSFTDTRLATLASATADLKAQLSELQRLREQVQRAQRSG
jgi:hypothetical protein